MYICKHLCPKAQDFPVKPGSSQSTLGKDKSLMCWLAMKPDDIVFISVPL